MAPGADNLGPVETLEKVFRGVGVNFPDFRTLTPSRRQRDTFSRVFLMENQALTSLVLAPSSLTMNSLEISSVAEVRHDNAKRVIKRLAAKGTIQLPQIEEVEDKQSLSPNSKTEAYLFTGEKGKRDSIVVIAQLNPEFTGDLVDRWYELEQQIRNPTSLTHADIQPLLDRISKLEEDNRLLEYKTDNNWKWIEFIHGQDPSELGLTRSVTKLVIKHHECFLETIDALTALEDRIDYIARLAPGRGEHKRVSDFLRKGPEPKQ